jgi:hypothetical protein
MKQYYIHDGQNEKGPFHFEELQSQSLGKETPVWCEGLESWTIAGNLDELKELFNKKITPPPFFKAIEKKESPGNGSINRHELLNSFSDAEEIYIESKKSSLVFFVIIIIIIIIIIAYFAFS